jgi:mannose-6-phosphate isomerase-like protein (cupin superfamily)
VSYTKRNLREVEDKAPDFGFSESQEARFANDALDTQDTGVSYHVVRANKRQGFGHRHDQAEEVYVVLSGAGSIKLDDDVVELAAMDAIRVAPQVARGFEAGPEGLEILAFGPRHQGDGEVLPDFWAD